MKIEVTEGITQEQWDYLTRWRERVFPAEGRGMQWSQSRWHVLAYDGPVKEGAAIANIGFNYFSIIADGVPMEVVGIGGVVVRPEYQGRNVPKILFDTLHTNGKVMQCLAGEFDKPDDKPPFTLFYPEPLLGYYQKHGYVEFKGDVIYLQHGNKVKADVFKLMIKAKPFDQHLNCQCIELTTAPW